MKKSLLIIPFIFLFCFSCQKMEVQSDPGIASSGTIENQAGIQLTITVDPADARGEIFFDYWDENGEHQSLTTTGEMAETVTVSPYSEILMTGHYKLDDPYGHYSYWVALNGDYIDMGMPYQVTGEFSFDHRVIIAPEQGSMQVLSVVIHKPSFP